MKRKTASSYFIKALMYLVLACIAVTFTVKTCIDINIEEMHSKLASVSTLDYNDPDEKILIDQAYELVAGVDELAKTEKRVICICAFTVAIMTFCITINVKEAIAIKKKEDTVDIDK